MAKYESKFAKLGFYCCGEFKQFQGGVYETDDKKEIEILDTLTDTVRVDEPKQVKQETKSEPKAEAKKPAANNRKPSAK